MRHPQLVVVFCFVLSHFDGMGANVVAQNLWERERAKMLVQSKELLDQPLPAKHQLDANAMGKVAPGKTPRF